MGIYYFNGIHWINLTNGMMPNSQGIAVSGAYGTTTTVAGTGVTGSADGMGTNASFNFPAGIAFDRAGNAYVADRFNRKIRKISPAGVVTIFAGSGAIGSADGAGTAASFRTPTGVAVDAAGNVYVADYSDHKIRKITPGGLVSTLAGTGAAGAVNGTGTAASFNTPNELAVDQGGNIYVADLFNQRIRKITPAGVVTTLAGGGPGVSTDGQGTAASFAFR